MFFDVLIVVIFILTIAISLYQNQIYKLAVWKLIIMIFVGAVVSCWGIFFFGYLEDGYWSHWSFSGCVFFVPIAFWLLSKLIKEPYWVLMEFCGPICALFFMLIKLNCLRAGCCWGRLLFTTNSGQEVYFPSPLFESIAGFIICIILLKLQKKETNRGKIAPYFLVMFGTSRFIFYLLRDGWKPLRPFNAVGLFLPTGLVWSFLILIAGVIWMRKAKKIFSGKVSCYNKLEKDE